MERLIDDLILKIEFYIEDLIYLLQEHGDIVSLNNIALIVLGLILLVIMLKVLITIRKNNKKK